jgi:hypothetical protein
VRVVALALVAAAICASHAVAQTAESVPVEPAAAPASAAPAPAAAKPGAAKPADALSSPAQVSTRGSAYSLPARTWSFDLGVLGVSSGDAYARLGIGYGIGAGIQVDLNLAHWAVGLFNLNARWQFLDTRYVDLGLGVGFIYGNGDWFWLATAEKLASAIDVMALPFSLNASVQAQRWLQFDLGLQYSYAEVWGEIGEKDSLYAEAQLGVRQFLVRPGVRFYISNATSVDFMATLPAHTAAPVEGDVETRLPGILFGGTRTAGYSKLPFSETWKLELGVRSRLATGLFGTMRLHYGQIASRLYGAKIYPSFDVEWRL